MLLKNARTMTACLVCISEPFCQFLQYIIRPASRPESFYIREKGDLQTLAPLSKADGFKHVLAPFFYHWWSCQSLAHAKREICCNCSPKDSATESCKHMAHCRNTLQTVSFIVFSCVFITSEKHKPDQQKVKNPA